MEQSHVEGQPAATLDAEALPTTPTPVEQAPAAATAGGEGEPARRRRKGKRRRARRVRPAEPAARAAAAAAALAEREPDPDPEDEIPSAEGATEGAEPAAEVGDPDGSAPAFDPGALAEACAPPLFRVVFKVLALAIRRRFPAGSVAIWTNAPDRAAALAPTLGARLAAGLGPVKFTVAAALAEVAEPFLLDAWEAGKAGNRTIEVRP